MFKKVKKLKLRGRIYAVVATERFERIDILCGQNTERINYFFLPGGRCRLYSAAVAGYWDPNHIDRYTSDLRNSECFSSWHKRNDKSGRAIISGQKDGIYENRKLVNAIDGFICQNSLKFDYDGFGSQWLQVDLKGLYALKCVRVPVRSTKAFHRSFFKGIQFRFGNETVYGNLEKSPVIGYADDDFMGKIVEYCPRYQLIGRFLIVSKMILMRAWKLLKSKLLFFE